MKNWIKRLMCGLGFHKWEKWSEKTVMNVTQRNRMTDVEFDSQYYVQTRICSRCGIEKARGVK